VKPQQVSLLKRPRIIGYRKSGAPIWLGQGAADEDPIERLEARNAELGALMEALLDEMKVEGRSESVRKEHESSWKSYEEELDKNSSQLDELRSEVKTREAREQKVRDARAKWGSQQVKSGAPEERDLFDVNLRMIGMEDPKIRKDMLSRSSRILDDDDIGGHLDDQQKRHITKLLRKQDADTDGELLAAFMIATSNPHYRSAFQKATSTLTPVFTAEEGRAVNEVNWIKRAMAIGTSASGGFAVPVVIDPTVILTAQGSTRTTCSGWPGSRRSRPTAGAACQLGRCLVEVRHRGGPSTDNSPDASPSPRSRRTVPTASSRTRSRSARTGPGSPRR
jgi:hypothetical protein